jgi:ubiquinone/menaquinone biosynthesis C-methylase UbiE
MSKSARQDTIVRQFGNPSGLIGRLVGWILALRPSNRKRNRRTVELLDIRPGERVLEIGCGPGVALQMILKKQPGVSCTGFDHSALMIEAARRRNRAEDRTGRLHLVIGGLDKLRYAGAGFNKLMMVNVSQFLTERVAAFRDLRAVMAPGGRAAITYQPRKSGATDDDGRSVANTISSELDTAGFTGLRIERLPLKPVAAYCVLAEVG